MRSHNTRRQVLLGLAAASTAAASAGHATEHMNYENRELVALGNATFGLQRTYEEAWADTCRIVSEVQSEWPLAPEQIIAFGEGCLEEKDVAGASIKRAIHGRGDLEQYWHYGTPEYFSAEIQRHEARIAKIRKSKSKRGLEYETVWLNRSREALPLSEAYVAEIERLKRQSGYQNASDRHRAALEAFREHVCLIMAAEAVTMEGVVIKAQALQAWSTVDTASKAFNQHGVEWAEQLAGAIVAQGAIQA